MPDLAPAGMQLKFMLSALEVYVVSTVAFPGCMHALRLPCCKTNAHQWGQQEGFARQCSHHKSRNDP